MRIAVCGIHIESSTFTKHVTTMADFDVARGDEVVAQHPVREWAPGADVVGVLTATCGAAGPIDPATYDALEDEMAERLAAVGPVDGVWLEMHGAMNVLGRERAEESWIRRVRDVVGAGPILSGSFDPHGNISRELAELVDLAAFHRHAPHIDNAQTRQRAVENLVVVIERGERPAKAWIRIPALLPGERTSTVVEPGHSVFGAQLPVIEKHQLVDAAICVGFFWADESRNAAAVLTTAWDEAAATAAAEELANGFWARHQEFQIVSDHYGSWAEALAFVRGDVARPVYISDSGDNITAGATGDITYAIQNTLADEVVREAGLHFLFAGLWDPDSLAAAVEVGAGGNLERAIGAAVDDRYGAAVDGPWTVVELTRDDDGNPIEALLRRDNIDVSVRAERSAYALYDDPGFPPGVTHGPGPTDTSAYDVVVVKNGYLFPSQADDAGSAFMALTPGGTDLDHERLTFTKISRPLYPWDEVTDPDLTAQIIQPYQPTDNPSQV